MGRRHTNLLTTLFVLLSALLIATPSTTEAAEKIAFVSTECWGPGAYDESFLCSRIAIMDTDGSNVMIVTDSVYDHQPALSPDGTRILFTRQGDVFVIAASGGSAINLTNHPAYDWSPAWSPDGAKVAFASDRQGQSELYVMNPDGTDIVRITNGVGFASRPAWSPDGTRLAFTCVMELSASPWWWANSATDNFDICVTNADGSGVVRLTAEPEADLTPAWAPDGARIAFATTRYGGEMFLTWGPFPVVERALMHPDGSSVTRLLAGRAGESPTWSPDSRRIAFAAVDPETDYGWGPLSFVYVMSADGTGLTLLVRGHSPSWSGQ